jgi:hypothetical protein
VVRVPYYVFMLAYHIYINEPISRVVFNKHDIYKSIVEVAQNKRHNITLMRPRDISSLSCLMINS